MNHFKKILCFLRGDVYWREAFKREMPLLQNFNFAFFQFQKITIEISVLVSLGNNNRERWEMTYYESCMYWYIVVTGNYVFRYTFLINSPPKGGIIR